MSAINDQIKAKGRLNIVVTGRDGKVKQDLLVPNVVVMYGKNYIARRMVTSGLPTEMTHMSIGQTSEAYGLVGGIYGQANTPATGNGNNFGSVTTNTWPSTLFSEQVRTTATRATGTTALTTVSTTYGASGSGAIAVSSGSGIAAGQYIVHPAIPQYTRVGSGYSSGTSIPLDFSQTTGPATTTLAFAINQPVSVASVTGTSGQYTISASSSTGIQVGMRATGTNLGTNAYVYSISGAGPYTITLTAANAGAVNTTVTFDNPIYFTNANTVTYQSTFAPGAAGAIVEAGIFNESTLTGTSNSDSLVGGSMLCRTTFPVVFKGVDDTMTITWTVTIQ
jgi:hypothetical protein